MSEIYVEMRNIANWICLHQSHLMRTSTSFVYVFCFFVLGTHYLHHGNMCFAGFLFLRNVFSLKEFELMNEINSILFAIYQWYRNTFFVKRELDSLFVYLFVNSSFRILRRNHPYFFNFLHKHQQWQKSNKNSSQWLRNFHCYFLKHFAAVYEVSRAHILTWIPY